MLNRRYNCCCFNHPCPIFCRSLCVNSCQNEVINPVIGANFGFFNNTNVGAVTGNTIIPLSVVQSGGTGVTSNGLGGISLVSGIYQVTYFASGEFPSGGILGVKLRLGGQDVANAVISETGTAGDVSTLTQTIVVNVPQEGAILELVNNSTQSVVFTLASMFVQRI